MMVRRPDNEADRRTSPSVEVKNEWNYSSTPAVCHHGMHEDDNLLKPSGFFTYGIQKFYMVLALRSVFCTDLRTNSDLCCIQH